jgi:hypothetical protein
MRIMQKRLVYLDCKSLADAVHIVNRSLQDKESSDHCDWYEKVGGEVTCTKGSSAGVMLAASVRA